MISLRLRTGNFLNWIRDLRRRYREDIYRDLGTTLLWQKDRSVPMLKKFLHFF